MNSCELVTTITALACSLQKCCSKEELTILAAAFTQLGDTLATIAVHNEICKSNGNSR